MSKFDQSGVTLAQPIRSQYMLTNGVAHYLSDTFVGFWVGALLAEILALEISGGDAMVREIVALLLITGYKPWVARGTKNESNYFELIQNKINLEFFWKLNDLKLN